MLDLLIKSYMNRLIEKITEKINSYDNKCLVSVILTGSLGRDEGTFHRNQDASDVVLDSDIELALVYRFGMKKEAEIIRDLLIKDFDEDMNPMVISESRVKNGYNFNYSVLRPKYSSIFMYDLYHGSKTIWGEDLICNNAQCYDIYEAKRIVANRIGELTYIETKKIGDKNIISQWEGKVLLALGSAYCILENAYVSKYEGQKDFVVRNQARVDTLLGKDFARNYELAFLYLRKGHDSHEVSREILREYVKNINHLFDKNSINTPKINSLSRKLKYAVSCFKSKIKLSPFVCEEEIINFLINYFISNDERIALMAVNWKSVLY